MESGVNNIMGRGRDKPKREPKKPKKKKKKKGK